MANASKGVSVQIQNLQQRNWYINKGQALYLCPSSVTISSFFNLSHDQEVVIVLGKPIGRIILEYGFSFVTKSGHGLRPGEAEAIRLISKHVSVPVPEVYYTNFISEYNECIEMSLIPGLH